MILFQVNNGRLFHILNIRLKKKNVVKDEKCENH